MNVTVDTTGGSLYGTLTFHFNTGTSTNGKVTGGTGAFKGATGTFTAKNLNKQGTRTASLSSITASGDERLAPRALVGPSARGLTGSTYGAWAHRCLECRCRGLASVPWQTSAAGTRTWSMN